MSRGSTLRNSELESRFEKVLMEFTKQSFVGTLSADSWWREETSPLVLGGHFSQARLELKCLEEPHSLLCDVSALAGS